MLVTRRSNRGTDVTGVAGDRTYQCCDCKSTGPVLITEKSYKHGNCPPFVFPPRPLIRWFAASAPFSASFCSVFHHRASLRCIPGEMELAMQVKSGVACGAIKRDERPGIFHPNNSHSLFFLLSQEPILLFIDNRARPTTVVPPPPLFTATRHIYSSPN